MKINIPDKMYDDMIDGVLYFSDLDAVIPDSDGDWVYCPEDGFDLKEMVLRMQRLNVLLEAIEYD